MPALPGLLVLLLLPERRAAGHPGFHERTCSLRFQRAHSDCTYSAFSLEKKMGTVNP